MRELLCISILLSLGVIGLRAQEYPVTVLDGQKMQIDSTFLSTMTKPAVSSTFLHPRFNELQVPSILVMPQGFETMEQRAARINFQTFNSVMTSVDLNLYWHRLPKMPKPWKQTLGAAKLFLSNPNGFPEGCVPLMNASFPFIYAKIPGMAPYDNPYTSDQFPKCIDSEYDFATGTYKQVMVDWAEVQNRMSATGQSSQPVPSVPITPVERMMHGTQ
ncbi:MAG: hypothetical protein MJY97_07660 [Bacteroidales bacterium]|nr:hypothetical protein [Bacteroidales bacterium]